MTKPLTAAYLIAKKKTNREIAVPAALAKELLTLCAYNDTEGRGHGRIGRDDALALCKAHGLTIAHATLDSICRQLGRQSYATK
jgi:hypothetical protein